ncbi:MAG: tetratricopeptide repeat protein [Gemmatimonadetes bacterium]|nr:tetratricopeptide repeat protein [Gemmatimonadota bacterium]
MATVIKVNVSALIDAAREAERVGDWDEALAGYSEALSHVCANGDGRRAPELLRWIGRIHFERGDYEGALEAFQASLAKAQASGQREPVAAALNCMAVVQQFRGRMDLVEPLYAQAAQVADEAGDQKLGAMVHQNLGTLANMRGDLALALQRYQSALERFRRLGDERTAARVLNNMGMLHVDAAQWGEAEMCFTSAFELAQRLGDAGTLAKVQINRTELALKRQDFEGARACCDQAYKIYSRLGSESGLAEAYKFYGALYRETGNSQLAHTHMTLALKLAQVCGDPLLEAEIENERALVYMKDGRHREALRCLNRGHALFRELRARRDLLDVERRLDHVEKIYLRVVQMLERDTPWAGDVTPDHYERVADYACMLAQAVGLNGRDLTWLRIGALLYDIGRTAIPPEVLNKPGPLTTGEWELVQRHPELGDEMVAELDPPWDIRPMARYHHEHWDGSGYPDGLSGEAIPLAARIVSVADIYAALTAPRSFRPPFSPRDALHIMERDAGRVLDPELFQTFRSLVHDGHAEVPALAWN